MDTSPQVSPGSCSLDLETHPAVDCSSVDRVGEGDPQISHNEMYFLDVEHTPCVTSTVPSVGGGPLSMEENREVSQVGGERSDAGSRAFHLEPHRTV